MLAAAGLFTSLFIAALTRDQLCLLKCNWFRYSGSEFINCL